MAKLTYALPLIVGALALTACPGDDGSADGGGSSTGGADDDNPTTTVTPPTTGASQTDDSTSTDPTVDPDTGQVMCVPECLPGQSCINGNCIGDPETTGYMCDTWGSGDYNNCVGGDPCGPGVPCVSDNPDNPTAGACAVIGCQDVCDCPDPSGFDGGMLVCDVLTADMQNGCFFSCQGGQACPTGMTCLGGFFCAYSTQEDVPSYGDCVNPPPGTQPCESGICLVDADPPTVGSCTPPCNVAADCPMPPPGGTVACADVTGDMNNECLLTCSGGGSCPDGMDCFMGQICMWPVMDAPPPAQDPYGDCVNNPLATCATGEDACVVDNPMNPMGGVCSQSGCAAAGDCPAAPATGSAVVTCGDVDGNGNTCYLDCSMGEMCPDGMTCDMGLQACVWPEMGMALDEDFESGTLKNGWTVNNVDGNIPAGAVSYVNDAWVVTDQVMPGMNFAAYSTSWYMPAGQSDDWLITPQIMLGAASTLTWEAMAPDMTYPDGYEVYVSTTGPAPADFMMNAPVFSVADEAQMFTMHSVDLAAAGFASELVYIAFRNNSNDEFILLVDNIQVTD